MSIRRNKEIQYLNIPHRKGIGGKDDRSAPHSPMSTLAGSSNIGGKSFLMLLENYAIRKS